MVDGTAEGVEITQEEATPLFGRRSPRKEKKNTYKSALDEQEEIARRLDELVGVQKDENDNLAQPSADIESPKQEPATALNDDTDSAVDDKVEFKQLSIEDFEETKSRFEVR
ncbi:MAG: hypothetical protein OSJ68_09415, partial [Clostridia bacterium]|nr:hypothetical protein [Clostridia bacterium]